MGVMDALGIRMEKLELKGDYLKMEDLFEAIKDVEFEAGKPMLAKTLSGNIIAFPQLDDKNQVQILPAGKNKYIVQRAVQPVGLESLLKNAIFDELSDGWTYVADTFGNTRKVCMELTTKTADTIRALGL